MRTTPDVSRRRAIPGSRAHAGRRIHCRPPPRTEIAADLARVRPHPRVTARRQRTLQQARGVFAAHGVAAKPVEVLDQARRDVIVALPGRPIFPDCRLSGSGCRVSACGSSPSTQTSLAPPPRCVETTSAAASLATRASPPGMTRTPSGVATAYTRIVSARAASSVDAADFHTGACDSRTCSCAT